MAQESCAQLINFCHLRIARLNATGNRLVGANNRYETAQGVEMGMEPVVKEAERFEQDNGCGNLCAVYDADCDHTTGWTLSLQMCSDDFEFQEMLVGGTLATSGGSTIGYQDPDPLAACYYGVMVEGWSIAWNGDEQLLHPVSGLPAYIKYLFPKVMWRPGNVTQAKGINILNFTGRAISNQNAGLGPTCDWPFIVNGPRGKMLTDTLPASNCGALPLIACSS